MPSIIANTFNISSGGQCLKLFNNVQQRCRGGPLCPPGARHRKRTDTGVCPYLANNDYTMQVVWHNLHHIQFNARVMFRHLMPCFVNHPTGIV